MVMVLLAHGHPAVRAWVRDALVLAPDIEFVAEASAGEEAWGLIQQIRWGVILIACRLPGTLSSVDIAEREQEVRSDVRMLILGTPDHDGLLCRLWRAGVVGCIPEGAPPEAIVEAVLAAASGKLLWTPEQVTRVQHWRDEVGSKLKMLSERERQVLETMAEAMGDCEIAERLSLSKHTVHSHVKSVLNKLRVRTRQEAIVFFLKRCGD